MRNSLHKLGTIFSACKKCMVIGFVYFKLREILFTLTHTEDPDRLYEDAQADQDMR